MAYGILQNGYEATVKTFTALYHTPYMTANKDFRQIIREKCVCVCVRKVLMWHMSLTFLLLVHSSKLTHINEFIFETCFSQNVS